MFNYYAHNLLKESSVDLVNKAKKIKLLILDVDGVLTDGKIYMGEDKELFKAFNVKDGLAITLLKHLGIKVAIITGRQSKIIEKRASELQIDDLFQNKKNKIPSYEELLLKYNLKDDEVAYMGDDILDLPILKRVGLSATVSDSAEDLEDICDFRSKYVGGSGAVREFIEFILKSQEKWDKVLAIISRGLDVKTISLEQ